MLVRIIKSLSKEGQKKRKVYIGTKVQRNPLLNLSSQVLI